MKQIELISKFLDEKKAENIAVFDMSKKDYFVSFVILATSLGPKHNQALIDDLEKLLKKEILRIDSTEEWGIIDMGDVLIHIFTQEKRELYKLENLLADI